MRPFLHHLQPPGWPLQDPPRSDHCTAGQMNPAEVALILSLSCSGVPSSLLPPGHSTPPPLPWPLRAAPTPLQHYSRVHPTHTSSGLSVALCFSLAFLDVVTSILDCLSFHPLVQNQQCPFPRYAITDPPQTKGLTSSPEFTRTLSLQLFSYRAEQPDLISVETHFLHPPLHCKLSRRGIVHNVTDTFCVEFVC